MPSLFIPNASGPGSVALEPDPDGGAADIVLRMMGRELCYLVEEAGGEGGGG